MGYRGRESTAATRSATRWASGGETELPSWACTDLRSPASSNSGG